jgi:ankyrin repeat protein
MASFLITQGAAVNARNIHGDTPLHLAAREQKEARAYGLLINGANPSNISMVKFLITQGSAVNARNMQGDTPLHLAARKQDKSMVYGLLINGADPSVENALHETPVHTATICPDLMATFVHAARQRQEPANIHSCLIC